MAEVTVYSTKNCPYCRMVKAFLEKQGVPYTNIDVGEDQEAAKKMVEISGQYGVPVSTIGEEIIIGFDAQRLNELFGATSRGDIYDVIIVGAGPAGLTAGVYCARKLLKTVLVSENVGGQALESWTIENYMGYRMISGDELMRKFEEQARSQQVSLELDRVISLTGADDLFALNTISGAVYRGRAIILAQGKRPRKLGVEGEERFLGKGLSICSTCDGPIFRDKRVAVVGGGNSALQTAIEMSGIAKEVHLIVRGKIRADEVYVNLFKSRNNIITHSDMVVSALHGEQVLTGITIQNRLTGEEQNIDLDGVFTEIGWIPNTDFVDGIVALNDQKEIIVDINCHTDILGIFAAGDVTNVRTKQIITASGEGAKAALEAHDYLMTR